MSDDGLPADVTSFTDFKKRDGKSAPYDGANAIVKFFAAVLIKLPMTLLVLVPVAAVGGLVSLCLPKSKKPDVAQPMSPIDASVNPKPKSDRQFDLVLFGATGFTGGLAADYLARQYGDDTTLRWALAGRKIAALEKVRARLAQINPRLAALPLLEADSSDDASLLALAADTKVVATTVGPYVKFGTALVRACIAHGTDYCDITGETSWVRELIESYHAQAAASGARIVQNAGHDCVPWDLLTQTLAQRTRAQDKADPEDLQSVEFLDDLAGAASGGTIATLLYHLSHPAPRSRLGYNPMDMTLDGERGTEKLRDAVQVKPGYSSRHKSWFGFFVMSTVNKECVRRSNVLLHYGDSLRYQEQLRLPGFVAVVAWTIDNLMQGVVLASTPLRALALKSGALPSPGEGPSVAQQDAGYLVLTGCGTGVRGTKTKAQMYFPKDAGYRDTARMLVESALSFAKEGDRVPAQRGGFLTPAAGLGNVLRDRLLATGCELEIMLEK